MGYFSDSQCAVVTDIVSGGPAAKRSRTRFEPDSVWQTEEIKKIYEASGRKVIYLGDWHSHPNGACRMSCTDTTTLKRIGRSRGARISTPVMLIFAGHKNYWKMAAWILVLRKKFLLRQIAGMEIISY